MKLPISYTLGLTRSCNSKCLTCNIWKTRVVDFKASEWKEVFKSLGHSPKWVTLSGGEPFLYPELFEVYLDLCETCKPKVVNIPTNGLLPTKVVRTVRNMLASSECRLIVNVSIDHSDPQKNDYIRGVAGHWQRAHRTFEELRSLDSKRLTVGIHTVISRLNVEDIWEIAEHLMSLSPQQYITEIAEERAELETKGFGLTPTYEQYSKAIEYVIQRMKAQRWKGLSRITRAFRLQYYKLVQEWLRTGSTGLKCRAGSRSCQIMSDGQVWYCCILGPEKAIGNLKDYNLNFAKLWESSKRESPSCSCPLANAAYTNMLYSPKQLLSVARNLL